MNSMDELVPALRSGNARAEPATHEDCESRRVGAGRERGRESGRVQEVCDDARRRVSDVERSKRERDEFKDRAGLWNFGVSGNVRD